MIGRVGDDGFANTLVENLTKDLIDCSSIKPVSQCPSGLAMISVSDAGENQIVVVPGANEHVTPAYVDRHAHVIQDADALLVQLEIPIDSVIRAIEIASRAGVRVILDPAPTPSQDAPAALFNVDLICPNETEAAALVGHEVETPEQIESAARLLMDRGAKAVAITRGSRGVTLFEANSMENDRITHVKAIPINPVDTTASGDAFAGAVAVIWCESNSLVEAIRFGNAAGALAATRRGAQPSIARRDEIVAKLSIVE